VKKPTIPGASASVPPTTRTSQNSSFEANHPPLPSTMRFTPETPFANTIEGPRYGAGNTSSKRACDTCANLWRMKLGGQIQNKKADGSEFVLTESYCIFKDSLVSLAERSVLECTRWTPKED